MVFRLPHKSPILATVFDDDYLYAWVVHLFSAERSRTQDFELVIALTSDGLSPDGQAFAAEVANWLDVQLRFIQVNLPDQLPVSDYFKPIVYARLCLADVLESTFTWVDVDTLMLPGWDAIFDFPEPEGNYVLRAAKAFEAKNLEMGLQNQARLRAGESYFNAGVLTINPTEWRKRGFVQEWPKLIRNYDYYGFQRLDQCVLNYLIFGQSLEFGPEFNYTPHPGNELNGEPRIIHFTGSGKPWKVPGIERHRPPSSHGAWVKIYWSMEKQMMRAAKHHSRELYARLRELRLRQRSHYDFSMKRLVRVVARALGELRGSKFSLR